MRELRVETEARQIARKRTLVAILIGLVEDLHTDDSKNVVGYQENGEESSD